LTYLEIRINTTVRFQILAQTPGDLTVQQRARIVTATGLSAASVTPTLTVLWMGVAPMRSATRGPLGLGMILLAIWLILTGLLPFLNVRIPQAGTALSVLAIVAGVMILLGR
jgi:hypothetical protein